MKKTDIRRKYLNFFVFGEIFWATKQTFYMTRHRILNPTTGRMVFKTGTLGQKIMKKKAKKKKPKDKGTVAKAKEKKFCRVAARVSKKKNTKKGGGLVAGKWYGEPGATKTIAYVKAAGKSKGFAPRPSARAMLNCGNTADQFYAGKWHYMHFDRHGRPTYKAY